MRAWWLALVLTVSAAGAGPFGKVPAGDPAYRDLEPLVAAGLTRAALVDYPRRDELTRFEFALLFSAALDELRRQVAASARSVDTPDPQVTQVTAALERLLHQFRDELVAVDVDPALAQLDLTDLPRRLARLTTGSRPGASQSRAGELLVPGLAPPLRSDPLSVSVRQGRLELGAGQEPLPWSADARREQIGARLSADLGAAEAGLSWREQAVLTTDDPLRPLLSGRILAADLRLRLGDQSVLVEYARGLAERRDGWLAERAQGQSIRAGYERALGSDWQLDLAFSRLTAAQTLFSRFSSGQPLPDLYGLEAGVAWHQGGWDVTSSAAVYRPEGEQVGYLNQLGTEVRYTPFRGLSLRLGYETSVQRRLRGLEDAWRDYVRAQIVYELSDSLRANLTYQGQFGSPGSPQRDANHVFGASLGIGF